VTAGYLTVPGPGGSWGGSGLSLGLSECAACTQLTCGTGRFARIWLWFGLALLGQQRVAFCYTTPGSSTHVLNGL
jgi:hypothetical protein